MDAWIGIVGALAGFVASGVVNNFTTKLQFERERRWQRDRLILEKLLEIAGLAEDIQRKLSKLYGNAISALESGTALQSDNDPIPMPRIKILIDFYAPQLRPDLKQIVQIRDGMGDLLGDVILSRPRDKAERGTFDEVLVSRLRDKKVRQQLNLQFVQGMKQINDACQRVAEAAAQSAQHRLGHDSSPEGTTAFKPP